MTSNSSPVKDEQQSNYKISQAANLKDINSYVSPYAINAVHQIELLQNNSDQRACSAGDLT